MEHKYIYLQPKCCVDGDDEIGRMWCQDDINDCECEPCVSWTRYVREDYVAEHMEKIPNTIENWESGKLGLSMEHAVVSSVVTNRERIAELEAKLQEYKDIVEFNILGDTIEIQTKRIAELEDANEKQTDLAYKLSLELIEKAERIAELEARLIKTTQGRSVEALKMAYRKHVKMDESIGWDELGDVLCNALCNEEGDDEFQKWSDSQDKRGS